MSFSYVICVSDLFDGHCCFDWDAYGSIRIDLCPLVGTSDHTSQVPVIKSMGYLYVVYRYYHTTAVCSSHWLTS